MKTNWWEKSITLAPIFQELENLGILEYKVSIKNIDLTPPKNIGCDLAIWTCQPNDSRGFQFDQDALITRVDILKNVVNVWINYDRLLDLSWPIIKSRPNVVVDNTLELSPSVAIEHTSLNTVFPINIPTFRGTVIGNATKEFLCSYGYNAKAHFFVEDLSRRNHVLLTSIKRLGIDSSAITSLEGKADHEIGYLYASTIMAAKRKDVEITSQLLSKMFPQAKSRLSLQVCDVIEEFDWNNYVNDHVYRSLREACIDAFRQTLQMCHVQIDRFDYEADIYKGCCEENSKNGHSFSRKSPSPLDKNLCYFSRLLERYDKVISILPNQLVTQPNTDESLVGKLTKTLKLSGFDIRLLKFAAYGDVFVNFDSSARGPADSISNGIFNSVDGYIEQFAGHPADNSNALKLFLLYQKHNITSIDLSSHDVTRGLYYRIVNTLRKASLLLGDVNSNSLIGPSEKKIIRDLIGLEKHLFEQLFEIPEFGKLIQSLETLSTDLDNILENTLKSSKCSSTRNRVILISSSVILHTLERIGIDISRGNIKELYTQLRLNAY